MIHRRYTLDYGSKKVQSKPASLVDDFIPTFFLDYISIIGRPRMPITRANRQVLNNFPMAVTFARWSAPYSGKHLYGLPFDLQHRTFRIGKAATRETWFIVMHPINPPMTRLPSSRSEAVKLKRKAAEKSALQTHHAQAMAAYITSVFLSGDLIGEGIEPSWTLGNSAVKEIDSNKWRVFQSRFMENWGAFVEQYSFDKFWVANQPAFHAYDYGANVEIEVTTRITSLPQEVSQRPADDTEDSDSDEGQSHQDAIRLAPEAADSPPPNLYSGGLQNLLVELEERYTLENIASISYTLAVNLHCLDSASLDPEFKSPLCMLADRNMVAREYSNPRDLTFFPLAFHPAYGNFSSPKPPAFLDPVLAILRDNMSYRNEGADVLSCGFFQGYSNVKRAIRHGPDDLLASKGMATGALTLPRSEAQGSAWIAKKQQRLLDQIEGKLSQESPDASRPFARERQRVEDTIVVDELAFRMEQIVSLDVTALIPAQRSFRTILQPIFQLMRFYLNEVEKYTHIMRCFRPQVFPTILCSFSRIFELALDEMCRRYRAESSTGLGMGLAEGVAALDRMGHYCFTGVAKALMPAVMGPLGTIESLQSCGWPYISPRMIDLREGDGAIDLTNWPTDKQGRPRCMHIASLLHYYGPEIAASRQALLWFKELGIHAIRGLSSAVQFLDDLFQNLWIPQTIAYVSHQITRHINQGYRSRIGNISEALGSLEDDRAILQTWADSDKPFCWEYISNSSTSSRQANLLFLEIMNRFIVSCRRVRRVWCPLRPGGTSPRTYARAVPKARYTLARHIPLCMRHGPRCSRPF